MTSKKGAAMTLRFLSGSVLLLAGGLMPAQQPKPDAIPDSGAVIRTDTKVVLVDTVVTDKKGNYVHSLTLKDFKVYEDNKEQTVKTFSFQSDPASPTNSQKRYIVLFFDYSTMDPGAQIQARQAAAKFIDSNSAPNRLMAIVNYGGAIQIAQNFTDDVDRLKQVVSGVKIAQVATNGNAGMQGLNKAAADFGARDMLLGLRSLAKNLSPISGRKTLILFTAGFPLNAERISEVTATIDMCNKSNVAVYPIDVRGLIAGAPVAELETPSYNAVRNVQRGLASAFGALLQPAAFTMSPGMSFFQRTGGGTTGGTTGGGGAGGRTGGGATGGTTGGTTGGRTGGTPAPVAGTTAPGTGRGGSTLNNNGLNNINGLGPNSQARNTLIPKMPETGIDNQSVMQMLADGTGGFVIKNTNDLLAGLEKIGKEMDEYYVLGYTPPESDEGSCHALRVKVDQGGTTVRSRSGYCNSKARDLLAGNPVEKTLENRAAAAQAGNVAATMQLPYFYTGPNVARVNVAMEIPADVLKFEKQKGKFHAEMNVLGIAYNADGSVGARFSDTLKRDFDDKKQVEAFQQVPFLHYENEFEVASGNYTFKVVFSGADAGKGAASFGKIERPLAIDPWASQFGLSGLALSKQIRQQAAMAQGLDASLIEDRVPLVSQGVQIIPFGSNKFSKAEPVLFYTEVYEPLLLNPDPKNKPVVGLQIRVLDRKTKDQKYSTGLMRLDMSGIADNPTIPLAERIPLDTIGPGQYVVEVEARDSSGKLATRTADFDLE
jgi:VWFA-related protein